jgi:hypothetical protein
LTSSDVTLEAAPVGGALWRAYESFRFGVREYLAFNPLLTLIAATLPRGVLQIVFFTLLGGDVLGSGDRERAFVGALVLALTGTNIIGVANVPVADKLYGTYWRLRLSTPPAQLVLGSRVLPYVCFGFVLLTVQGSIAAVLLGLGGFAIDLAPWLPLYALMGFGFAVFVLAAATLTVARRADVLAPNLAAFVVVLTSGAVLKPGRIGWIDALGALLPVRHGLVAVQDGMAGAPWAAQASQEAVIALGYLAVAALAIRLQDYRARRLGLDDFA